MKAEIETRGRLIFVCSCADHLAEDMEYIENIRAEHIKLALVVELVLALVRSFNFNVICKLFSRSKYGSYVIRYMYTFSYFDAQMIAPYFGKVLNAKTLKLQGLTLN